MSIFTFFVNEVQAVKRFFTGAKFHKIEDVAKQIASIVQLALPAVELVAQFTPASGAVHTLIELLHKYNVPYTFDATQPLHPEEWNNYLNVAAKAIFKGDLRTAIINAGASGLAFGDTRIHDVEGIPNNILDTAVQTAYTFFKATLEVPTPTPVPVG